MKLTDLPGRRCVVGINYFDLDGSLLRQRQLGGEVAKADVEQGITLTLENGEFVLPTRPGWGVEVNEAAVRARPPKK